MDQVHLPDPVLHKMRELHKENTQLRRRIEQIEVGIRCIQERTPDCEECYDAEVDFDSYYEQELKEEME